MIYVVSILPNFLKYFVKNKNPNLIRKKEEKLNNLSEGNIFIINK